LPFIAAYLNGVALPWHSGVFLCWRGKVLGLSP
jgi:hypothetical protein